MVEQATYSERVRCEQLILDDGQQCADCASVVGLYSEDACCCAKDLLAVQQRGSTVVGSHTNILKDEGSQKEPLVIVVRAVWWVQSQVGSNIGSYRESLADVECWALYSVVAKSSLQELDVCDLIECNLLSVSCTAQTKEFGRKGSRCDVSDPSSSSTDDEKCTAFLREHCTESKKLWHSQSDGQLH
jgi:hypothetical protein